MTSQVRAEFFVEALYIGPGSKLRQFDVDLVQHLSRTCRKGGADTGCWVGNVAVPELSADDVPFVVGNY